MTLKLYFVKTCHWRSSSSAFLPTLVYPWKKTIQDVMFLLYAITWENYYLSFPSFLLQKTWSKYNWYYFQFPYRYWKENISLSMFIKLLGLVWKVYLIWSLEFLVFSYRERIPSVFFSFDVNCTCEESEDVHSQFSCVLFYDPQNSFCFAFFS